MTEFAHQMSKVAFSEVSKLGYSVKISGPNFLYSLLAKNREARDFLLKFMVQHDWKKHTPQSNSGPRYHYSPSKVYMPNPRFGTKGPKLVTYSLCLDVPYLRLLLCHDHSKYNGEDIHIEDKKGTNLLLRDFDFLESLITNPINNKLFRETVARLIKTSRYLRALPVWAEKMGIPVAPKENQ